MTDEVKEGSFLGPGPTKERRPMLPWVIAGAVVVLVLIVLLIAGRTTAPTNPGGPGLAPPDPYAKSLALTNIKMSESSSVIGLKQTYLDGDITNNGDKTLTGITVQVAFQDFTNRIGQKNTMPMQLIRSHQPYVDVEPVSAAPIQPGQTREFRLIFDHVTDQWNQEYPEVRVIAVQSK
jgi:hypothetical protein